MQDARKGVLFDEFPPVLQLQLKRFEYDFQRDIMVKVSSAVSPVTACIGTADQGVQLCVPPVCCKEPGSC